MPRADERPREALVADAAGRARPRAPLDVDASRRPRPRAPRASRRSSFQSRNPLNLADAPAAARAGRGRLPEVAVAAPAPAGRGGRRRLHAPLRAASRRRSSALVASHILGAGRPRGSVGNRVPLHRAGREVLSRRVRPRRADRPGPPLLADARPAGSPTGRHLSRDVRQGNHCSRMTYAIYLRAL